MWAWWQQSRSMRENWMGISWIPTSKADQSIWREEGNRCGVKRSFLTACAIHIMWEGQGCGRPFCSEIQGVLLKVPLSVSGVHAVLWVKSRGGQSQKVLWNLLEAGRLSISSCIMPFLMLVNSKTSISKSSTFVPYLPTAAKGNRE